MRADADSRILMGGEEVDNIVTVTFICFTTGLALMLGLVPKKVQRILFFMIIGFLCCFLASEINAVFLDMFNDDIYYVTTTITPIVEELLKGIPIIIFAIFFSDDPPTVIACSYALGVGFAILESTIVMLQSINDISMLMALTRSFGAGLIHSICTVMVGVSIIYTKKYPRIMPVALFSMISAAIITHAYYNSLIQSNLMIIGLIFPILVYLPSSIRLRRKMIKNKQKRIEQLLPEE